MHMTSLRMDARSGVWSGGCALGGMSAGTSLLEGVPTRRLQVDPAVDDLARDTASADHDWYLYAELSAILSTTLALDAAEAALHPRPQIERRRFRSRLDAGHYEIHVADIEPVILAHTVPELQLSSVSNVNVLEGDLSAPRSRPRCAA